MPAFVRHGNYCGPNWTAGKPIETKNVNKRDFFRVPPVDLLDRICWEHDFMYWKAHNRTNDERLRKKMFKIADRRFSKNIKNAQIPGYTDNIADFLVWIKGSGQKLRDGDYDDVNAIVNAQGEETFISEFDKQDTLQEMGKKGNLKREGQPLPNVIQPDSQHGPNYRWDKGTQTETATQTEASLSNLPSNTAMDGQEIRVKPHKPSYGYQNIHTTVIPYKAYIGVTNLGSNAKILKINTNSLYNTINTALTTSTSAEALADGFFQGTFSYGTTGDAKPGNPGMTAGDEKLFWRNYWAKIYKCYSVVGCKVSMTVQTLGIGMNDGIQIGWLTCSDETRPPDQVKAGFTLADGAKNTKNIPIVMFDSWKNTKRKYIPSRANGHQSGRETLTFHCDPGSVEHEAIDLHKVVDGTVQSEVWTKCGAAPADKEFLQLYFWKDPLAYTGTDATATFGCNIELNISFIVQFRDLRHYLRYPTGWEAANQPAQGTLTTKDPESIEESVPTANLITQVGGLD